MKAFYLELNDSVRCNIVGFCINSHLEPKEASLVWVEQGTDLWVQWWYIIRSCFSVICL